MPRSHLIFCLFSLFGSFFFCLFCSSLFALLYWSWSSGPLFLTLCGHGSPKSLSQARPALQRTILMNKLLHLTVLINWPASLHQSALGRKTLWLWPEHSLLYWVDSIPSSDPAKDVSARRAPRCNKPISSRNPCRNRLQDSCQMNSGPLPRSPPALQ